MVVSTLTGQAINLNVAPSTSISDLKAMIQCHGAGQPEQQRLIFRGKQLADDHSLGAYGIQPGCMIHLVIRLRGGCNYVSVQHDVPIALKNPSVSLLPESHANCPVAGWSLVLYLF